MSRIHEAFKKAEQERPIGASPETMSPPAVPPGATREAQRAATEILDLSHGAPRGLLISSPLKVGEPAPPLHATSRVDGTQSQSKTKKLLVGFRGSMSRRTFARPPLGGEMFLLTSPFIERRYTRARSPQRTPQPGDSILWNDVQRVQWATRIIRFVTGLLVWIHRFGKTWFEALNSRSSQLPNA